METLYHNNILSLLVRVISASLISNHTFFGPTSPRLGIWAQLNQTGITAITTSLWQHQIVIILLPIAYMNMNT